MREGEVEEGEEEEQFFSYQARVGRGMDFFFGSGYL